jgi:hypothetical protein
MCTRWISLCPAFEDDRERTARHRRPARGDYWFDYHDHVSNDFPENETYGFLTITAATASTPAAFSVFGHIDRDEFIALRKSLAPAIRLGEREMFELIEANYSELTAKNNFYVRLFGRGKDQGRIPAPQAGAGFMAACINWLNVVRLFLDHETTRLSRTFGAESEQLAEFKAATATAFDSSIAYRFLYKLRNYVTHCGLPISTVSLERPALEEQPKGLVQKIVFQLDRDMLLRDHDGWGPHVKPDLARFDRTFELLPLIHEAMSHIRMIMEAAWRIDVREALGSVEAIRAAVTAQNRPNEQLYLVVMRKKADGRIELSPTPIPIEVLDKLASVDPNGDVLDPCRVEDRTIAEPPSFSSEENTQLERGTLVVSAALNNGIGSTAFAEVVNEIISEDGDVSPLISGLAILGLTAIYMGALAMNTSAESILTSFAPATSGGTAEGTAEAIHGALPADEPEWTSQSQGAGDVE